MTSAAEIALVRGGQRLADGGYLVRCPVLGHGQGRLHPSLRLVDGNRRLLVSCFAGCHSRDVLDALRRCGLLDDARDREPRPIQKPAPVPKRAVDQREYEEAQRRRARWLWAVRRPILGPPAETYLRARGIICELPFATLGYLPARAAHPHSLIAACGRHDEPEPGVLGLVQGLVDAVHITRLAGRHAYYKADIKSPKITIGSPRGRPIELAAANDLLGLAICEGIEDALSVHQATGLGAWAAGSAPFLPDLADAVPGWMSCVTILVDRDPAGRRFSLSASRRAGSLSNCESFNNEQREPQIRRCERYFARIWCRRPARELRYRIRAGARAER